MESEAVTQVTHEVVTVCPETDGDGSTSVDKTPNWDRRFA